MGSRKTHARRVERLREEGVGEEEIGRVSSPVGLDLGGEDPGEIAVAIVAELVAHRRGKLASLRSGGGDEPGRHAPGARPGPGGREGRRAPDGDRGSA
jgi:xanthine dehydrogenase accessory factor